MYCLLHTPHLYFKISTCNNDETLLNFNKNKTPKKGRERETKGKDQNLGKQTTQRGMTHKEKGTTMYPNFH